MEPLISRSFAATALPLALAAAALASTGCGKRPARNDEAERRDAFVKRLAFAEDAGQSWALTSRDGLVFGDGWFRMENHPFGDARGHAWRWMARTAVVQIRTGRVEGKLKMEGWVPDDVLGSRPVITFTVDGVLLASIVAMGREWRLEETVPASMQRRDWIDVTLATSAVASPPNDARELGVALTNVVWEPR